MVDDEPDARHLIATTLAAQGAEVATAPSAQQALEMLRAACPTVLVSDIGMPETDGYELIRRVRALDGAATARVPAIARRCRPSPRAA